MKYAGNGGVIGTTPAENLKGIRELMSVTPTLEDAEALYPSMMRVSKALEELSGGAKKADETMPVLAKALENIGGGIDPLTHKLDPERMRLATNEALKTIIAGGGFIDAQALFGLAKQAGGMGRLSDPGKLFDEVITSLIDMGGPRTGTALAATGRQFLGDKMTVQTANELEDLGLLPDGGWRKAGGTGIIMNPEVDIKGVDEIKDGRIADWFLNTVGPAIEAKFGANVSTADLIQESSKMFGQRTGQRLALMFLANEAQRQRDVAIKNSVDPSGVVQGITDKDYGANLDNLGKSIQGFAQVLGSTEIPTAIAGLHVLADAFHLLTSGLAEVAAVSPNLAKALVPFTPSMIEAGWGAAKDQLENLSNALGSIEKWWHEQPTASHSQYANGGGPGESFKGGDEPAHDTWTNWLKSLTGFKFGKEAEDSNAADKSLYDAGYGYWNPSVAVEAEEARERRRATALAFRVDKGSTTPSPLPVKVVEPIPTDLAAKRAQFGLDRQNNAIVAKPLHDDSRLGIGKAPLPVTIVGTVPVDLADKRAMFAKMNPTSALAPIKPAYDPPTSIRLQAPTVNVPPPPVVNTKVEVAASQVDTKVDVKVTARLDGMLYALAAKIEKMVESSLRIPTSTAGTDGRAQHMPPDAYSP